MDLLTFISNLIQAIAWPAAVIFGILLFRKPLSSFIPLLTKLRYGEVELEFNKGIAELSKRTEVELPNAERTAESDEFHDRVLTLIQVSPKAAIVETWRKVESKLLDVARHQDVDLDDNLIKNPIKLGDILLRRHIIDESQSSIIGEMRRLRNATVHYTPKVISAEDALAYLDSAQRLLSALEDKIS